MRLLILILLLPFVVNAQIIRANSYYTARASGGFSPTDISGIKLWVKADQLSLSDGDPVSTWADQSGLGNDITSSGSNRPTFKTGILNSLPVVRFDGSDDFMEKSSFSGVDGVAGMTIFLVVKMASFSNDQTFVSKWDYNTQGSFAWQSAYDNANPNEQSGIFIADAVNDAGNNKAETTDNTSLSSFGILTMVYDGSLTNANRVKMYYNGTARTMSTSGTIPTALTTATSSLKIGKFGGALTRYFNGDFAEIIIYNSALNSTDRASVRTYLQTKYGL